MRLHICRLLRERPVPASHLRSGDGKNPKHDVLTGSHWSAGLRFIMKTALMFYPHKQKHAEGRGWGVPSSDWISAALPGFLFVFWADKKVRTWSPCETLNVVLKINTLAGKGGQRKAVRVSSCQTADQNAASASWLLLIFIWSTLTNRQHLTASDRRWTQITNKNGVYPLSVSA